MAEQQPAGALPSMPLALAHVWPAAVPGLQAYAQMLASDAVTRGLIGPREVPRIWDRHIANCALAEAVIPHSATVADVGSGAGLPGLVLALVRPDLRVSLIEPLLRRATFLTEAVQQLGLESRVQVIRARAEDARSAVASTPGGQADWLPADVVTARAVAALPQLLQWCWPLVKPGGGLALLKGESAQAELVEAESALRACGIQPQWARVETVEQADSHVTLVVIDRPDRQG